MKKKKIYLIGIFIIIVALLQIDNKLYDYGLGKGIISKKLPSGFSPYYRGTDLGSKGFALVDVESSNTEIISNFYTVNDSIKVKRLLSYCNYDGKILVRFIDKNNILRMISIETNSQDSNTLEFYRYTFLNEKKVHEKKMQWIDVRDPYGQNHIFIKIRFWLLSLLFLLFILTLIKMIKGRGSN